MGLTETVKEYTILAISLDCKLSDIRVIRRPFRGTRLQSWRSLPLGARFWQVVLLALWKLVSFTFLMAEEN